MAKVQGLPKKGEETLMKLHSMTELGDAVSVRAALAEAEIGPESLNEPINGMPLICIAAAGGHLDVVREIYELGGDLDATTTDNKAALHFAAANDCPEIVAFLLDNGADFPSKCASYDAVLNSFQRRSEKYKELLVGDDDEGAAEREKYEMKKRCAKQLHFLLQYDGRPGETLASLPLVRDTVLALLCTHRASALMVADGLTLLGLLSLYTTVAWVLQHEGPLTGGDALLLSGLFVCSGFIVIRELVQGSIALRLSELRTWQRDLWNLVDLAAGSAGLTLAIASLWGEPLRTGAAYRLIAGVGAIPIWTKILGNIKVVNLKFATFVSGLVQITRDIRSFLVVLFIALVASGFTLFIILHPRDEALFEDEEEDPFGSIGETLLTNYRMLLGDFERDWFLAPRDEASEDVATLLFVLYLFLMNVLLLNVLIAVVSDSYDYSVTRSRGIFYRARLALASELQAIFAIVVPKTTEEREPIWERFICARLVEGVLWACQVHRCGPTAANVATVLVAVALLPVCLPLVIFDCLVVLLNYFSATESTVDDARDLEEENAWKGRTAETVSMVGQVLEQSEDKLQAKVADAVEDKVRSVLERLEALEASLQQRQQEMEQKLDVVLELLDSRQDRK
eukprot:scaffold1220_cov259-Pinguiococcus_pyrenoidosus.AAC.117